MPFCFSCGGWWVAAFFACVALCFVFGRLCRRGSCGPGSTQGPIGTSEHREPIDILKERFARGEISEKDFQRMKKALS